MLQTLTASLGDTLIYDASDPGGFTLEQHSNYAPTIAKIFSQQWDVVVLQEQSERPAFPPNQVAAEVYPYAHMLDSMIHVNDSCTQTMFMMTWGHADGDPPNCPFYPVICTYDGMQQRLRESYMQMTQDNHAIVAPVGAAWKVMRDSFPALWLYQADSVHPLVSGSYLESCVLYGSIFHKHTLGSNYLAGLSASDAGTLQRIADKVTLDSLTQWQQYGHYPTAAFSYTTNGTTVSFFYSDSGTAANAWAFGDAATSAASSPTHTYSTNGDYLATHTVSTNCFTETISDTIHIGTAAVNNIEATRNTVQLLQNGHTVKFVLKGDIVNDRLIIYSIDGRLLNHYLFSDNEVTEQFPAGLYVYKIFQIQGSTITGKFVVY